MIQWRYPDRPLILASRSPRRSQILSLLGFSFETAVPDLDNEEEFIDTSDLNGSLRKLARAKAEAVSKNRPEALVLGADTVVVIGGSVLGKPSDAEEAFTMLRTLSGSRHQVLTSVSLVCQECHFARSSITSTEVYFRGVGDEEIREYLRGDEYRDKAGAYAIQGRAMIFIDRIDGCFYNVMGLPVTDTINLFIAYISRKESADV